MVARGDDNMYRIGEFSYLFELSIKTLRYYDEINLLSQHIKIHLQDIDIIQTFKRMNLLIY